MPLYDLSFIGITETDDTVHSWQGKLMRQQGWAYLRSKWNLLELAIIILSWSALSVFIKRTLLGKRDIEYYQYNKDQLGKPLMHFYSLMHVCVNRSRDTILYYDSQIYVPFTTFVKKYWLKILVFPFPLLKQGCVLSCNL